MRASVGEVQDAGRHLRRRPVGCDVGKAHDRGRDRDRHGQVEHDLREAQDRQRLVERRRGEHRSEGLVRAQVPRQAVGRAAGAPRQRAAGARRCPMPVALDERVCRSLIRQPPRERQRSRGEVPRPRLDRRVGERLGRAPATGPGRRERLGRCVVPFEPCQGRIGRRFVAGVAAAPQPAIEEADHLVELVEVRTGCPLGRQLVDPVADDRPGGRGAQRLHPQRRIDIRVHPAADVQDRDVDRLVVRGEGARPPIGAVALPAQPFEQPRRRRLEPSPPFGEPALAAELDVGWHRVHRDLAHGVLAELARGHAPADVMHVGRVAVVGGHDRDDRAQVRRAKLRDLDRGEPAVADAPHRDVAVAPLPGREPLDRVVPVARLVLAVFVERDAAGAAGTADVEPAERVAPAREVLAAAHVRVAPPVVLAIRDHLEDRREAGIHGVAGTGQRTPDVGRQLHAVAHR